MFPKKLYNRALRSGWVGNGRILNALIVFHERVFPPFENQNFTWAPSALRIGSVVNGIIYNAELFCN